jgi:hypothetical protein
VEGGSYTLQYTYNSTILQDYNSRDGRLVVSTRTQLVDGWIFDLVTESNPGYVWIVNQISHTVKHGLASQLVVLVEGCNKSLDYSLVS